MKTFELSKKQLSVAESILDWFKSSKYQYITLGGYAGTGKTTLLGYLSEYLFKERKDLKIAFCSYTGKASRVLYRKLMDVGFSNKDCYIGTIHRLIYRAVVDENDNIIDWEKISEDEFKYDLIIVDESSMVTEEIWKDLLSFNRPILAVGDHGQLPPVKGSFNLMEKPNLTLEEIYRQEINNPIIKLSEMVRKYGTLPYEEYSKCVKKLRKEDIDTQELISNMFESFNEDMMVLCGYNRTRINLNKGIRALHFDSPMPQVGDRVICLKNNRTAEIFNGMTGTILDITKESNGENSHYETEISLDYEETPFWGKISIEQFNSTELKEKPIEDLNYFDFGYALTVHKAQGSQAKKVILFDERFPKMTDDDYRRWLYTAVTRAEEELYIVG
jgi:exodeoxyribonuclease-5